MVTRFALQMQGIVCSPLPWLGVRGRREAQVELCPGALECVIRWEKKGFRSHPPQLQQEFSGFALCL